MARSRSRGAGSLDPSDALGSFDGQVCPGFMEGSIRGNSANLGRAASKSTLHPGPRVLEARATCISCSRASMAATICPTAPTQPRRASSVALPESIGASVGTAIPSDFENTDCIFYIGQNVGTSSPRLLHDLQDAVDRGVPIGTFNMLRERGLGALREPAIAGRKC